MIKYGLVGWVMGTLLSIPFHGITLYSVVVGGFLMVSSFAFGGLVELVEPVYEYKKLEYVSEKR